MVPFDRISDRRAAEDAEIVGPVRVLPDVLAVHHQILAKSLLEAGVELIARAGSQWNGKARIALEGRHEIIDNRVVASLAGQNQVLVKGRLQDAGIRKP